jgi:hypothetical protein
VGASARANTKPEVLRISIGELVIFDHFWQRFGNREFLSFSSRRGGGREWQRIYSFNDKARRLKSRIMMV